MSKKVFDENISGLPELVSADNNEQPTDLDLIIDLPMNVEAKPEEVKPQINYNDIFMMGNKKTLRENKPLKEPIDTITSSDIRGVTEEEDETNIELSIEPTREKYANIGKRGRDKKPRKKRVMTDAQKEKLAKARQKSLEVRRAKARAKYADKKKKKDEKVTSDPIPIPVNIPKDNMKNFDKFCEYMERYEQRKMKKVSFSQDPHPNKIIPTAQKPRPPVINKKIPQVINKVTPQPQPRLRDTPQVIPFKPPDAPTSMMDKFNAIRSSNRMGFGSRW
jgi:hypothetical protein